MRRVLLVILAFLTNRSYFINFCFVQSNPSFVFSQLITSAQVRNTVHRLLLSILCRFDSRLLSIPIEAVTQLRLQCNLRLSQLCRAGIARNFIDASFSVSFTLFQLRRPELGINTRYSFLVLCFFFFLFLPILFDSLLERRLLLQLWVIFATQGKTTSTFFLHLGHVFYLLAFFLSHFLCDCRKKSANYLCGVRRMYLYSE